MTPTPLRAALRRLRQLAGPGGGELTDRELLRRFTAERDESAFAALVGRHGGLVLGACRRVLRHEQDAEDAFQATFLILARKAGSVGWQASAAGWLHRVALRLALESRAAADRRRARERAAPAREAEPAPA